MKPEMILQSNLLDILFDNRNKAYGAYDLRSQYNRRLSKAILITVAVVFLFSVTLYVQANFFGGARSSVAGMPTEVVTLKSVKDKKEIKKIDKQKTAAKSNIIQVANPVYRIVVDDSADKKIPDNKELDNAQIGLVSVTGKGDTGYYPQQGSYGVDTGTAKPPEQSVVKENTEPFQTAEIMPEFPGGNEAFSKFMLRNLKEAKDLEEGEKVVVQARFVVEANGAIDNIEIQNNASRYDNEVLRVIRKMPQWKPAMQNGIHVPVYLTLPVTFQGRD